MKKLLLGLLGLYVPFSLTNMTYDPVANVIYTLPATQDINQDEYRTLLIYCIGLEQNIKNINSGKYPSYRELVSQCRHYLKQVGSPAAIRLIADLEKDKVFYPNGSVMRKLSE